MESITEEYYNTWMILNKAKISGRANARYPYIVEMLLYKYENRKERM